MRSRVTVALAVWPVFTYADLTGLRTNKYLQDICFLIINQDGWKQECTALSATLPTRALPLSSILNLILSSTGANALSVVSSIEIETSKNFGRIVASAYNYLELYTLKIKPGCKPIMESLFLKYCHVTSEPNSLHLCTSTVIKL